jgi:hypothetical protein
MLQPREIVRSFEVAGFTHVVWIPDSTIGRWESALVAAESLTLVRPCREGEAVGIAAGLMLGGARPLVAMQCTGLFEAGDAIRNVVHDLGLPLKLFVGIRSFAAVAVGKSRDNCPTFTLPIVEAWRLPSRLIELSASSTFEADLRWLVAEPGAAALLMPE